MGRSVSISNYWYDHLTMAIDSDARKSRATIVEEALSRYWPILEREIEAWKEFKEEKKHAD